MNDIKKDDTEKKRDVAAIIETVATILGAIAAGLGGIAEVVKQRNDK